MMGTTTIRTNFAALGLALLLGACGGSGGGTGPAPEPTYAERIAAAWAAYESGDAAGARDGFAAAVADDAGPMEGHVGLGWAKLALDDLVGAHDAFSAADARSGPDGLRADLHAGWAFGWNARQEVVGRHSESNDQVEAVESLDSAWTFSHRPDLDHEDLIVLAAENHFALGEFTESLARVKTLDPIFSADVGTPAGRAALADRIEELRAETG